jgi:hypothetical protein
MLCPQAANFTHVTSLNKLIIISGASSSFNDQKLERKKRNSQGMLMITLLKSAGIWIECMKVDAMIL